MGKPRDLANLISTGNPLADGAIAVSEISNLTATAAELNIMDGVTATTSELNIMDGVTATTAELNKMDGVTVSASDINSVTAKAPAASPTFTGDVTIPDKIVHDGDTNTALRFPAADTVTVETGGSERTRVDSSGHFYIGKTSSSSAVVGTFIQGTGGIDATRDGNRVFVANRLSSDGEIINLQKDNSTVGSIAADNLNITISAYGEEYQALSGTSVTIDCRAGNNFALTTSGNTTFTFSNATSSGTAFGFTLKLTSGGSHTITYPNSVDFAGGTAPDAPASGETDILVFYTVDGGTNWYGALAIDAAG